MKPATPRFAGLHPGPGFRIRLDFERLDTARVKRLQDYKVADISDKLNRLHLLDPGLRCLTPKSPRLLGPVCTVRVFPGDNLMAHKALDVAKPNDIIAVDGHGIHAPTAVLGDIVCIKAKHRGIAGFIIDGLVRDLPEIEELDFPVFARGTTSVGPSHRGPGEINYPISLGGMVVNPGDVVVADASGIVVIPRQHTEETVQRLEADRERKQAYMEAVRRGEFSNAWADELLNQHDCQITTGETDSRASSHT